MNANDAHLRYHRARAADVAAARRHDLARVHPLERRPPLGALRRLLARGPVATAPAPQP